MSQESQDPLHKEIKKGGLIRARILNFQGAQESISRNQFLHSM
jgi:hypothetical protein